jgi:hypothetical protein
METGQEIKMEELIRMSFGSYGFKNACSLLIEFIE